MVVTIWVPYSVLGPISTGWKENNLQSEGGKARPYRRYWGLLDCHCHWQAPPLRSLEDGQ